MLGTGVRFRFDDLEWASSCEVKRHVSLGVVRESELLHNVRCIIIDNRPLLHRDMLATIHLYRFVKRELRRDGVSVQI